MNKDFPHRKPKASRRMTVANSERPQTRLDLQFNSLQSELKSLKSQRRKLLSCGSPLKQLQVELKRISNENKVLRAPASRLEAAMHGFHSAVQSLI